MRDAVEALEILDILLAERRRLVDIAQRVLKCRARAEDVVQEIALKLCEKRLSKNPCSDQRLGNPRAYLARMVRNAAIDTVRRTMVECQQLAPIAAAEGTASPASCPLKRMEMCETLRTVATVLAGEPARARLALLAHRLGAVPQKTIATQLGVSPTLVNFMIRDATIHCRRALVDDASLNPAGGPREAIPTLHRLAGTSANRGCREAAVGHAG